MNHAVMIMGFGDDRIAQRTIDILDNKHIDFFIHWDKKFQLPHFKSKYSRIFYCRNRIDVKWGQYTEIQAEKELLHTVEENNNDYDYVHLISSSDIPLFTSNYFINYFTKDAYIGYKHPNLPRVEKRLSFYYPISRVDVRNKLWLIKIIKITNYIFGINRLKNKKVKMGPQWFTIKGKYVSQVLSFDDSIFKNSFLGSEEFIQMALPQFDPEVEVTDINAEALRYIKWVGKGKPHPKTFSVKDVKELKKLINTKYAFARKVSDPLVIDRVFD